MLNEEEIVWLDATAQAELVRQKEISAAELLECTIARIEKVNPKINAVIHTMFDQARSHVEASQNDGPFEGVPFLLKDVIAAYKGVPMTFGAKRFKEYTPDRHSELVNRFQKAGLNILGKTNVPELGFSSTTEPRFNGPTRNPWDTDRMAGGSSGGAAAAVAAGMVPMAHGSDTGGSIRIPASCCGVFGFKPTRGRNPLGPDFGDAMGGFLCEHALTRSVRDSAALLDATAGPSLGDPYMAPPKTGFYLDEVSTKPRKLRIALFTEPSHPDCKAAAEHAATLCEELGHEVEEAAPKLDMRTLGRDFMTIFSSSAAWTADYLMQGQEEKLKPEDFEPQTWAMLEWGWKNSASDFMLAQTRLQQISREAAKFFEDYDMLLSPTLGEPPLPLGTLDPTPEKPLAGTFRAGKFIPFTSLANVTGQPAMSMPLHWNGDGLPIGVQFQAKFGDEMTLFQLAGQLEETDPWAHRRPSF
jgi:amidase